MVMALRHVSLMLLVVLVGPVCSEDQHGTRLSLSPVTGWNETKQQGEFVVVADGGRLYNRERRQILASDQRPLDYEFFRGVGYYKYHTKAEIWEQARRICESEGAHLMIVNSDSEIRVLRSFLVRNLPTSGSDTSTYFHAGFSDLETEGHFVTVLGEPLRVSSYNKWLPGQPDNNPRENMDTGANCGCIVHNMLLDDCWWSSVLTFWCEMPL